MPTTTEHGIPYPVEGDVANVPSDMQALANKVEDLFYTNPAWATDVQEAIEAKIFIQPLGTPFPPNPDEDAILFYYQT